MFEAFQMHYLSLSLSRSSSRKTSGKCDAPSSLEHDGQCKIAIVMQSKWQSTVGWLNRLRSASAPTRCIVHRVVQWLGFLFFSPRYCLFQGETFFGGFSIFFFECLLPLLLGFLHSHHCVLCVWIGIAPFFFGLKCGTQWDV